MTLSILITCCSAQIESFLSFSFSLFLVPSKTEKLSLSIPAYPSFCHSVMLSVVGALVPVK